MRTVHMRHPDLPDQAIEVMEASVPHHAAAGWEVFEPEPVKVNPVAWAETEDAPERPAARKKAAAKPTEKEGE